MSLLEPLDEAQMKIGVRIAAVWLCSCLVAYSAPQATDEAKMDSGAAAVASTAERKIIDLAIGAVPAIGVDCILRVLEHTTGKRPEWQIDALEDAFEVSKWIAAEYPLRYFGVKNRTTIGLLVSSMSNDTHMDRLSTECRIVRTMLKENRGRAREMFAAIGDHPVMRTTGCQDQFIPDLTVYYDTVISILGEGFADVDIDQGGREAFLEEEIGKVSSSLQVPGITRVALIARESGDGLERIMNLLAGRLAMIRDGDPAISVALNYTTLTDDILALSTRAVESRINPFFLLSAFRSYVVENLGKSRCKQLLDESSYLEKIPDRDWRKHFEAAVSKGGNFFGLGIEPIEQEEIEPTKLVEAERVTLSFDHGAGNAVWNRFNDLPFMFSDATGLEWESQVQGLLSDLEGWSEEAGENQVTHFVEKCTVYKQLMEKTAVTGLANSVIEAYVRFLAGSPIQSIDSGMWVRCVEGLVNFDESDVPKPGDERDEGFAIEIAPRGVADVRRVALEKILNSPDLELFLYGRSIQLRAQPSVREEK